MILIEEIMSKILNLLVVYISVAAVYCIPERCSLKKDSGNCKSPTTMNKSPTSMNYPTYFWNATESKCESFYYSGCGGNANRFYSLNDCNEVCGPEIDQCEQRPKTGQCLAYFVRYFYNSTVNRCQKFIYGGCQANKNNFKSEKECLYKCQEKTFFVRIIDFFRFWNRSYA